MSKTIIPSTQEGTPKAENLFSRAFMGSGEEDSEIKFEYQRVDDNSSLKSVVTEKLNATEYFLQGAGISEEMAAAISGGKRKPTIYRILNLSKEDIEAAAKEPGDITYFTNARDYVKDFRKNNSRFPNWETEFGDEAIYEFLEEAEEKSKSTAESEEKIISEESTSIKFKLATPRITDYPKFNGQMEKWYAFRSEFESVAASHGVGQILVKDTDFEGRKEPDYKAKSAFVYAVLKYACTNGTAQNKVQVFEQDQSGYHAWHCLKEYYENAGSKQRLKAELHRELQGLKLTYNSYGGFDKYVNDFETIVRRLDDIDAKPEDDEMKTKFIDGIQDRDLVPIITFVENNDETNYEDTVKIIRSTAKKLGKIGSQKFVRKANQKGNKNGNGKRSQKGKNNRSANKAESNDGGKGGNKPGTVPRLPPEVWSKMLQEQRSTYINGLKSRKDDDKKPFDAQYSRSNNSAEKSDEKPTQGNKSASFDWSRSNNMMKQVDPDNEEQESSDSTKEAEIVYELPDPIPDWYKPLTLEDNSEEEEKPKKVTQSPQVTQTQESQEDTVTEIEEKVISKDLTKSSKDRTKRKFKKQKTFKKFRRERNPATRTT